jgi:hypothetical protein
MLRLFRRTKIESWELELLKATIAKLLGDYSVLSSQIDDGLLRGVLLDASDIPGYVAFAFQPDVLKKYDRENEPDFKIKGIKVYDMKSSGFLDYEIYVCSGTISGYALSGNKNRKIDTGRVDVSKMRKEFIRSKDYHRILPFLTSEEQKLLNPGEVYSVFVGDREFFHVKDLEDGDFIGIDKKKMVYRITHDPVTVTLLDSAIPDIVKL